MLSVIALSDTLTACFQRQLSVAALGNLSALGADCQVELPGCTARLLSTGRLHQLLLETDCQAALITALSDSSWQYQCCQCSQ
jgi:hypothetical protein